MYGSDQELVVRGYVDATSVKGVDGKFDYFPPGFGFRRSGALEHRNPTKTYVVPYHMYKSVV